jgi:hypothetical protein
MDMQPQAYPPKWGVYGDKVFNTQIRRFTDHLKDYGSHSTSSPAIQYTTFTCSNSDNTKVVFKIGDRNGVFYRVSDGAFLRYKNFGPPEGGDMELRWAQSSPDLLFYRQGGRFYQYNYATDTPTLLHDFSKWYPGLSRIDNNDKGEQSWGNDQYWAFRVRLSVDDGNENWASYLVCYDRLSDSKWDVDLSKYYSSRGWGDTRPAPRYVAMCPSGRYLIAMFVNGGSRGYGHTALFARNNTTGKLDWVRDIVDGQSGHPAWGYDLQGNEVFYYFNAPYFYMVDIDTAQRYTLLSAVHDCPACENKDYYAGGPNYHISTCYKVPGWAFFTSYRGSTDLSCLSWLDRVVFAVRASRNPSQVLVWRIAHTRTHTTDYNNQARAQISQDGQHVYFDSNFLGTQDREIFRAELPTEWWKEMKVVGDTTPPAHPQGFAAITP